MVYDSEQNLVRDFKNTFIISFNTTENFLILNEVDTSWGRVDLLAIHYDNIQFKIRKNLLQNKSIKPFTNLAAYAISYITENPYCNTEQLSKFLKVRNGKFIETIEILKDRGLIHLYKNNKLRARTIKNTYLIKEIQTFEAKINNWKRVINQAERHLWFTNSSYIVLPNISESVLAKVKNTCAEKGIGLIIQNNKDAFQIIKKPLNKKHIDSVFSWRLNESLVDGSLKYG